ALHRPAILRVPATAIRLLMGESSVLVLGGARARSKTHESARVCLPSDLFKKPHSDLNKKNKLKPKTKTKKKTLSYKQNRPPHTKPNISYSLFCLKKTGGGG
ncbi:hypothetical protein ACVGW1_05905, partial [Enterobacter intestinihominis]